jgi:hypothetical protein
VGVNSHGKGVSSRGQEQAAVCVSERGKEREGGRESSLLMDVRPRVLVLKSASG